MAVLVDGGRAALATAILNSDAIHVAWGAGDESWGGTPPAESLSATALVDEIGRRKATEVAYVEADELGTIVLPNGTWSITATPTQFLYVRTLFAFADAPSAVIREVAVFLNTVAEVGVPPGQLYLEPADVADAGQMYSLQNLSAAITRSPTTREQFEFVLTF